MNLQVFNKYLHFIHPHISFNYNEKTKQISTTAINPIDNGTLILLEEGIVGTTKQVIRQMSKEEELNNLLYPRENNSDLDIIRKKYNHNAFEWDEKQKTYGLFYTISRINHNCDPNVFVVEVTNLGKPLFAVFSIKDIKKGDEIMLSYGDDVGHSNHTIFNWKCDCGLTDIERKKTFNKAQKSAHDYLKFEYHYLTFLLNCYQDDEEVWEEENDIQNCEYN